MARNYRIEVLRLTDEMPQVTHLITEGEHVDADKLARALQRVGAAKQSDCSFWWKETQVTVEPDAHEQPQVRVKANNEPLAKHAA